MDNNMQFTNPQINDNSKLDDHASVDQSNHITVQGNYNASNSNNSELTKKQNQAHPWITVMLCCSMMGMMWFALQRSLDKNRFDEQTDIQNISHQLEATTKDSVGIHKQITKNLEQTRLQISEMESEIEVAKTQAREGTIWLLRDDIVKSIEYYEAAKMISQKQFKRIKDEFSYYTSIGGNHDVKDKFDNFYTKIFGTQEIKMVSSLDDR